MFFSWKKEHTPAEGCSNYSQYEFPELTYTPRCYSKNTVKKTVNSIARLISRRCNGSKCIIESDAVNRAVWAELIAKRVGKGAKHQVVLLQETHDYDDDVKRFLRFKYDRHELAGITDKSMSLVFGDDTVETREDSRIYAYCNNVIEENCRDDFSSKLNKDAALTFGSIGRLDKKCVNGILKGFRTYAKNHPEKRYNLVLIGGATGKKRIAQIREVMSRSKNIDLIITDYLYPIPASLINSIDLFVSTAGSSVVSFWNHQPTIMVHPVTGEPTGILGLDDFEGRTMYDSLCGETVSDCIGRAIRNIDKIEYTHGFDDYDQDMFAEFDRQLSFADIAGESKYYSTAQLMKICPTHIKGQKAHYILGHVLGARGMNKTIELAKKIKRV